MLNTSKPRQVLSTSEVELCRWLGQALPGDVLHYHRGFLALDTAPHTFRLSDRERAELIKVGRRARWAFEKGLADLLQRRHGPDDYEYLLVARRRPYFGRVALADFAAPSPITGEVAP